MAYSPNLFGSNGAMAAWRKITSIIGYDGDDDYQMGDRPLMKLISKTSLKKNRRKLIEAVSKSEDTYIPGILIIGYLMMTKGLPLTSDLSQHLRVALAESRLRIDSVPKAHQKQRLRQISHLENLIDGEYQPSLKGTRVLLYYGSQAERKRAHKRDKRERELKKRRVRHRKEMNEADVRAFAYTFLLMRIFNSAQKTRRLFQTYAPSIDQSKLCDWLYNAGYTDNRCRPNEYFLNRINTLLNDKYSEFKDGL